MKLGKYFTIEEMIASETATRRGIDNAPGPREVAALTELVRHVLDPLRVALGQLVMINSGYRCKRLNEAVGGVPDSDHLRGEAADIHVPGMLVSELLAKIRSLDLPYDRLINEFGRWVHLSYGPRQRHQVLTARTVNGRTVYN